jgi:hypothetical protein
VNDVSLCRDLRIHLLIPFFIILPYQSLGDEIKIFLHLPFFGNQLPFFKMPQFQVRLYQMIKLLFRESDELMNKLEKWMKMIHQ